MRVPGGARSGEEMKAAKGKTGYEVPAKRARGAPPPTIAWKLFRGALITTISMWAPPAAACPGCRCRPERDIGGRAHFSSRSVRLMLRTSGAMSDLRTSEISGALCSAEPVSASHWLDLLLPRRRFFSHALLRLLSSIARLIWVPQPRRLQLARVATSVRVACDGTHPICVGASGGAALGKLIEG